MSRFARNAFVLGVGLVVFWLERRRRARPWVEPPVRHTSRNLVVAGIAAATVNLIETPTVLPVSRWATRNGWGLTRAIRGPEWLRTLVAVLLLDYTLYLWHILVHHVPPLWRFHVVHHVDLDLDATTALRFHAGELTLSIPWRVAQIVVIGVTPTALAAWQSLTLASIMFHHSNSRLPDPVARALRWLVVTPQMHAIHHSIDPSQTDSNFSSGLAIWDRIHGTFRLDASASEVTIGVAEFREPATLVECLELPFSKRSLEPVVPA